MRFKLDANLGEGWNFEKECELCGEVLKDCKCNQKVIKEPKQHKLHFRKEKRNGKIVTVIEGFYLEDGKLKAILNQLKKRLATGGSIKGDTIELQGDCVIKAKEELKDFGQK